MPNKQTNKVRLCKRTIKRIKQRYSESSKKNRKRNSRSWGVGKLIFVIGTMDTVAYNQAIDYYKIDVLFLSNNNQLIFQQDMLPVMLAREQEKNWKK